MKKFFSPIILTISLLLLIYTFYKSEIFWEGSKRNYYLTYYIIYSIFFFFSIITFFISKKIKEYLIIIAVSCILSLYLFEGYLTYKVQLSQIAREKAYKKITGNKWDKRSSFEIYKELKKADKKVGVSVLPINFMSKNYPLLPLSGISNTKIIFCNENGYYANYRSDRYGFNNPDDQWDKNEIEYLLVGDSFTHGSCVNRPNDIGSVLRTLTSKPVLNLGLGGNGPLIEYATLREYLNVNVKKVIWIYYGNDIENLVVEKKNNILIKYLDDLNFTQNLKLKQNEIDNLAIEMINELQLQMKEESKQSKFRLKDFIKIYKTRILFFSEIPAELPREFRQVLQLTKKLVEKKGSKLFFVYLPEYTRYRFNYDDKRYNEVKNIVDELNIPFIDIHKEAFENEKNPLKFFPFELTGHYNIEGYKTVAETIYKFTAD